MKIFFFLTIFSLLLAFNSCLPDEAVKQKQEAIAKAKMDSLFTNTQGNIVMPGDSSK